MPQLSQETVTILVGIVGLFLALFPTMRTISKDREASIIQRTQTNEKLTSIQGGIDNVKEKQAEFSIQLERSDERLDKMLERVIVVEQSSKSAHKRLDDLIASLSAQN